MYFRTSSDSSSSLAGSIRSVKVVRCRSKDEDIDCDLTSAAPEETSSQIVDHPIVALYSAGNSISLACVNLGESVNVDVIELFHIRSPGHACRLIKATLSDDPTTLLISAQQLNTQWLATLESVLPNACSVSLPASEFDEEEGRSLINDKGMLQQIQRFAALGALSNYAKKHVDLSKLQIRVRRPSNRLILNIGAQTLLSELEKLIRCLTTVGNRQLRDELKEPLSSLSQIKGRQHAIRFLLEHSEIRRDIENFLRLFRDVGSLVATLTYRRTKRDESYYRSVVRSFVALRELLFSLDDLRCCLSAAVRNNVLYIQDRVLSALEPRPLRPLLKSLVEVMERDIAQAPKRWLGIGAEVTARSHQIELLFAVQEGRCAFLDAARRVYGELLREVTEYHDTLRSKYDDVTIGYSDHNGFFISMTADLPLPADFILSCKKRGRTLCSSKKLFSVNSRLKDVRAEILATTCSELNFLSEEVGNAATLLTGVVQAVAEVDVICALSSLAHQNRPVVEPEFQSEELTIQNARMVGTKSPLIDHRMTHRIHIEFCMDSSTKPLKEKVLCTAIVLAHLGSFVPAGCVRLPLLKYLSFHEGCVGGQLGQASAFQQSMRRLRDELQAVENVENGASLMLMRHLAQGTSTCDGLSLCQATLEHLETHAPRCFVHVSTQYRGLRKLSLADAVFEGNEDREKWLNSLPSVFRESTRALLDPINS